MNERESVAANGKPHTRSGWRRIVAAATHSQDGLMQAWRLEAAFRQEVIAAAVLIPLACWLPLSRLEALLLVASVLAVLVVELLNSAVEATVDRVSHDFHEMSKRAKDIGSAAVLVTMAATLLVWLVVLWPLIH